MKKSILLLICLSSVADLSAQKAGKLATVPASSTFKPQGTVISSLNSAGFSKLINQQVANSGAINPASISSNKNFSFGLAYQFESDIDTAWIGGIGHKRGQQAKPQAFAAIGRFKDFYIGMAFHQRYNSNSHLDIEITTVELPQGTGETFSVRENEYIDAFSFIAAYTLPQSEKICLGLRLGYNILRIRESINSLSDNVKTDAFSGAFGLTLQLDDNILTGLYYEKAPAFYKKIEARVYSDIKRDSIVILAPLRSAYKNRRPDLMNLALSLKHNETFRSVIDLTYIFWQQSNQNARNNLDIAGSFLISLENNLNLALALLLTGRDFNNDYFSMNTKLNGLFLMAGFEKKFELWDLNLSLASSHLISGQWREQLIGKVGFDLYL